MLATEVNHLMLQIEEHLQQSFSQQYEQLLYTTDKTDKYAYFFVLHILPVIWSQGPAVRGGRWGNCHHAK